MSRFHERHWYFRGPFGDLHLDLGSSFRSGTREELDESRRELDSLLVQGIQWHDPGARQVLEEIYWALRGQRVPDRGRSAPGPSHESSMEQDLRFAGYCGHLRVARIERTRTAPILVDVPDAAEAALGPAPESEATKTTWFSLKVLDEVGDPVDGIDVAYSLGAQRRVVTTDGAGVARLSGVDAGSAASAGLASLTAVQQKLTPRWSRPRSPRIPTANSVVVRDLHDATDTLSLQAESPTTLVLTPFFRCNEVAGAHFMFGRSFVLSSALDLLADIAEALSGDDGRKGMIFGHTDLSGPEGLNKELSERRAKAIYALLTHDSGMWEELYSGSADGQNWQEKWDLEEVQHMLNALGCTDDDGMALTEDGVRGPRTIQAIHRFYSGDYPDCPAEQAPLAPSDHLGVAGRKELFLAYAKRVTRKPVDPERLSKIGSTKYMGCGQYNPLSLTIKDVESRRAVVFVFDPAAEPQGLPCALRTTGPCTSNCGPLPEAPDPDGKPPYRCKVYQEVAKSCPCQGGVDLSHDLILRVPYTLQQAKSLPHVFTLTSDDGTMKIDRSLASDARAADDERAEIYFAHLPEIHAYTLTCNDDTGSYVLFDKVPYDDLQGVTRATSTQPEPLSSVDTPPDIPIVDPGANA